MSKDGTWFRHSFKGTALIAATLMIVTGGAGVALARPTTHPVKVTSSLVPLRQVGLGWSIFEYSAASVSHKGKTTLYAVSPQGRRFAFYSWPASARSGLSLVDWSGDGQRVLVGNGFNKFEQISLVTGKVISTFKLPPLDVVIGYTRPHGQNVLARNSVGGILRFDLKGKLTKRLTKSSNGAIESPDGTSVIVGTNHGIEQVSNLGGVIKREHPPVATDGGCNPVRWWNATTVLGICVAKSVPASPRLWLFPIRGGKVTALTAQRNHSPDLGDVDAWKLTSGVYLQAFGACGLEFIATQSRNGSVHQVTIPGVRYSSDHIITGHGSSLLVEARSPCSGGDVFVWFNPHTKSVNRLFRTPANVIGVESVVPFGRPLS